MATKSAKHNYQNASVSVEERVQNLLPLMTMDEKCAQLGSRWVFELMEDFKFNNHKAQLLLNHGIGQITRVGGATTLPPNEAAEMANSIQKHLLENTRLGIPAIIHEECCSGLMTRGATLFPQAIGMASSWNPDLIEKMTGVIGTQMRAMGAQQGLAPVLDITRDPRWGRTEETLGEDPYLTARLGCSYIKGLQEKEGQLVSIATGKHFVGYGAAEGGMNWSPSHIPERQLHEVFLFPFEAAVKEANLRSVMNAYGELDGLPCCASKKLFQDILKQQWQFNGLVVSDYFAINMLYEYHQTAKDKSEAARQALAAGIDIELPATDCYGDPLKEALKSGALKTEDLDGIVRRILTLKFELGLFDHPFADAEKTPLVFNTENQKQLAYKAACESMVLLKNENILPLASEIKSIAVIGPNANNWRNMIGDYAYPCHIETLIEMQEEENPFGMPASDSLGDISDALEIDSVFEAIKNQVSETTQVLYEKGCDITGGSKEDFEAATKIAKQADVAILVVGGKSGLTKGCTSGESRDRVNINLPGQQEALIKAVAETGTKVVVVMIHGRPYAMDNIDKYAHAILSAWLPGQEGGKAISDTLFGNVNPAGKLPISFPRASGQIPVYYSHKPSGGRSHWTGDYVDFKSTPFYPFGFGLSYAQFAFSNLTINQTEADFNALIKIAFDIKNTSGCEGEEIAQLYIHYRPEGSLITRPVKELKGFNKILVLAGQTKHCEFILQVQQCAYYHEDMSYAVDPGTVEVMIGSSSDQIHLKGLVKIKNGSGDLSKNKVFFSESNSSIP